MTAENDEIEPRTISRRTVLAGGGAAALIAALGADVLRPDLVFAAPAGYVQPFSGTMPPITTSFNELDRLNWDPPQPNHRHKGTDYGAAAGRDVRAIAAGTVVESRFDSEYGEMVLIGHASGITSRYGHFQSRLVSEGQTVSAGQVIGQVGTTGWSTAPHLHLEIIVNGALTDPVAFLNGTSTNPTPTSLNEGEDELEPKLVSDGVAVYLATAGSPMMHIINQAHLAAVQAVLRTPRGEITMLGSLAPVQAVESYFMRILP